MRSNHLTAKTPQLVYFFGFFFIVFLYPFLRIVMLEQSLEDVKNMQKKQSVHPFFKSIETMSHSSFEMILLSIVFNVMEKNKVVYIWGSKFIVQYLAAIYQIIMKYRRPCQLESMRGLIKIEDECYQSGYGSPASGCLILSYLATSLYLNKYYEVAKQAVKYESVMCTGYIVKMGMTAFIGAYFIMLTFS